MSYAYSAPPVVPVSCDFCHKPMTLETGMAAFEWNVQPVQVTWGHELCVPSPAYQIPFDRLVKDGLDGPNGWGTHLQKKVWFDLEASWALDQAYEIACVLAKVATRPVQIMRSVTDSIPRRRPRTPDNPRAISTGTRTRVLERDGFRCRRCGHGPDVAPLVVDHIVPVARGGTAAIENLQTLCRPCNAGKSDREPTAHDLERGSR